MFDDVEFITKHDQVKFTAQTNDDIIIITDIDVSAEKAAAIAYLVNQPENLKIEIKKVGN